MTYDLENPGFLLMFVRILFADNTTTDASTSTALRGEIPAEAIPQYYLMYALAPSTVADSNFFPFFFFYHFIIFFGAILFGALLCAVRLFEKPMQTELYNGKRLDFQVIF